jgi:hypothetical protein
MKSALQQLNEFDFDTDLDQAEILRRRANRKRKVNLAHRHPDEQLPEQDREDDSTDI